MKHYLPPQLIIQDSALSRRRVEKSSVVTCSWGRQQIRLSDEDWRGWFIFISELRVDAVWGDDHPCCWRLRRGLEPPALSVTSPDTVIDDSSRAFHLLQVLQSSGGTSSGLVLRTSCNWNSVWKIVNAWFVEFYRNLTNKTNHISTLNKMYLINLFVRYYNNWVLLSRHGNKNFT